MYVQTFKYQYRSFIYCKKLLSVPTRLSVPNFFLSPLITTNLPVTPLLSLTSSDQGASQCSVAPVPPPSLLLLWSASHLGIKMIMPYTACGTVCTSLCSSLRTYLVWDVTFWHPTDGEQAPIMVNSDQGYYEPESTFNVHILGLWTPRHIRQTHSRDAQFYPT